MGQHSGLAMVRPSWRSRECKQGLLQVDMAAALVASAFMEASP